MITFDRYTDRARKVVQLAYQAANRTGATFVGTDHILLGLIREGSGVAAHVVKRLDVSFDEMRWEIEGSFEASDGPPLLGPLRKFELILQCSTPQLQELFECAASEARILQHNYVGTEHLLLALLLERDGIAPVMLSRWGLKHDIVKAEVQKMLGPVAPDIQPRMTC